MVEQDMTQENSLGKTPMGDKTREEMIYSVENKVPVGSVDKSRAPRRDYDESYPIPPARPDPFRDY
ncbi:hypothetical protein [Brevibacillus sp. SYSU BS000544]|uniref:hypothetical protein n=1 Tax=Brevibacillus sp. SYSU BS000544 TaxID=3416443 RepID=UPI003CE599C1